MGIRRCSLLVSLAVWCVGASLPAFGQDCNGNGIFDGWEVTMPLEGHALYLDNGITDSDGTDDEYVDVGNDMTLDLRNNFTLEAWVLPTTVSGIRKRVISKGIPAVNGYGFGSGDNSGNLRFTTFGVLDYDTAGVYLSTGDWTHIAVVLDSANDAHFFVNGEFVEQVNGPAPARVNSLPLHIGRNPFDEGSEPWVGVVDELRVWGVPRSDDEIFENYDRTLDGSEEGLISYWRLDEGEGLFTEDLAGVNDGILLGGPTWIPWAADVNDNGIPDECECLADLDGSGAVDFGDILAVLSAWGNAGGPEDLDGSGIVDFGDILGILADWGPCP